MTDLSVTINQSKTNKKSSSVVIRLDPDRFERLAADLGLFNPEFMSSLKRAERDIKAKKTRRITNLSQLA